MTRPVTFTSTEIAAVARAALNGVRFAMISRPDGTKVILPAADADLHGEIEDIDARLSEFAAR